MNNLFYIVNVEAAIYRQDKWLLAKRSVMEKHAAGTLAMIGGKVENVQTMSNVLEETLVREIAEEVGIAVDDDMKYVKSSAFVTDDGRQVVGVVFLCHYKEGEPTVLDPKELSSVAWLTYQEIENHENIQPWTKESLKIAEQMRKIRQDNIT